MEQQLATCDETRDDNERRQRQIQQMKHYADSDSHVDRLEQRVGDMELMKDEKIQQLQHIQLDWLISWNCCLIHLDSNWQFSFHFTFHCLVTYILTNNSSETKPTRR